MLIGLLFGLMSEVCTVENEELTEKFRTQLQKFPNYEATKSEKRAWLADIYGNPTPDLSVSVARYKGGESVYITSSNRSRSKGQRPQSVTRRFDSKDGKCYLSSINRS